MIHSICDHLLTHPPPRDYCSTVVDVRYIREKLDVLSLQTPWWSFASHPDTHELDLALLRVVGDYAGDEKTRPVVGEIPPQALLLVLETLITRSMGSSVGTTQALAARILANLVLHSETAQAFLPHLLGSPLFVQLVRWSRAPSALDPPRKLQSFRALSNLHRPARLDRHPERFVSAYHDAVYVFHPTTATDTLAVEDEPDASSSSGIDIVFVHGLRGDPISTWRTYSPPGAPPSTTIWPLEWLPADLEGIVGEVLHGGAHHEEGAGHVFSQSELKVLEARRAPARQVAEWVRFGVGMSRFVDASSSKLPVIVDGGEGEEGGAERAEAAAPGASRKVIRASDARIVSVGYDSVWSEWDGTSLTLDERAGTLLDKLVAAGIGRDGRRVVFVVHSMGGILVKQALVFAETMAPMLLARTIGVCFYATPHFGSWLPEIASYARSVYRPSKDLGLLRMGSSRLRCLNELFARFEHIEVLSVGEERAIPLPPEVPSSPLRIVVVPQESAFPGYGRFVSVKADHLSVCKPIDADDVIYGVLLDFLWDVVRGGGAGGGGWSGGE